MMVASNTAHGELMRAGLRNRVEPRGPERSAASEPPDGEPQPASRPMDFERLTRIGRARRGKATWRGTARERPLIPIDKSEQPTAPRSRHPSLHHRDSGGTGDDTTLT